MGVWMAPTRPKCTSQAHERSDDAFANGWHRNEGTKHGNVLMVAIHLYAAFGTQAGVEVLSSPTPDTRMSPLCRRKMLNQLLVDFLLRLL